MLQLPQIIVGACTRRARKVVETQFGGYIGIVDKCPYAWNRNKQVKREQLFGIDVDAKIKKGSVGHFLASVKVDWTFLSGLWYYSYSEAKPWVEFLSGVVKNVVVPCAGRHIVPDLPENVIVGVDSTTLGVPGRKPPVPYEQLEGKDVCLLNGPPRVQWWRYCSLILAGANVVAVRLSGTWNRIATEGYIGTELEIVRKKNVNVEWAINHTLRNIVTFWIKGIRRTERFIGPDAPLLSPGQLLGPR